MTLKRPKIARQHITIRDPDSGTSRTVTTYESTFDETFRRIVEAVSQSGEPNTKVRRGKTSAA